MRERRKRPGVSQRWTNGYEKSVIAVYVSAYNPWGRVVQPRDTRLGPLYEGGKGAVSQYLAGAASWTSSYGDTSAAVSSGAHEQPGAGVHLS